MEDFSIIFSPLISKFFRFKIIKIIKYKKANHCKLSKKLTVKLSKKLPKTFYFFFFNILIKSLIDIICSSVPVKNNKYKEEKKFFDDFHLKKIF